MAGRNQSHRYVAYIYILQSEKNKKYYIGCSNNYKRRLREHNKGQNLSTKFGCPWAIVYLESFEEQQEAFEREKKIKSYKGGNGLKKLIN
ncbi:MAG: GIY-YIG nuclease family protein [bacterium]|nr:GIY-YIG nuclease family protein [bacterium]MDZ4205708.1 GIY-YIG nuclease family protein [Patescibacteria group bacterium]